MIVTHVIPYMHPNAGGPPVVVDRLCHRLATRGTTVHVVTTDSMDDGTAPDWRKRLSDLYSLEVHRRARASQLLFGSHLDAAIEAAAKRSDLVHLHTLWTYPTYAAARACRKWDIPYVVMPHGMMDPHSLQRKRLKKWTYSRLFEWPTLRAAQGMIYTHREEQRLAEGVVQNLPRGHIVPLGADDPPALSREALAERFYQRNPGLRTRRLVLFLGRLHSKKGLDLLLPAFKEVVKRRQDAHLLMVGPGDESYVAQLRSQIAHLEMTNSVSLVGSLLGDAKYEAIAASAVFVLPSYQENFALTVVEAMRVGLPVVLSRRVNIWEDIVEAQAGLACELTSASVAERLLEYLDDETVCQKAGARGIQLVKDRFNWDATVDAMEAVYRQIIPAAASSNML